MAGRGWEPFETAAKGHRAFWGHGSSAPVCCRRKRRQSWKSGLTFCSAFGNAFDNQMPSKLFSYLGTGKPLLHLAVTDTDPTLPFTWRSIRWRWCCTKKNGVTPEVVDTLRRWLTDVQGSVALCTGGRPHPEFTPE